MAYIEVQIMQYNNNKIMMIQAFTCLSYTPFDLQHFWAGQIGVLQSMYLKISISYLNYLDDTSLDHGFHKVFHMSSKVIIS